MGWASRDNLRELVGIFRWFAAAKSGKEWGNTEENGELEMPKWNIKIFLCLSIRVRAHFESRNRYNHLIRIPTSALLASFALPRFQEYIEKDVLADLF